MDINHITCPHGHNFLHLVFDMAWLWVVIAATPFFIVKQKIKDLIFRSKS